MCGGGTEQARVIGSYAGDVCEAGRLHQAVNMTLCNDNRNVLSQMPVIVPCSFMPLAPRLLDGKNTFRCQHHHQIHYTDTGYKAFLESHFCFPIYIISIFGTFREPRFLISVQSTLTLVSSYSES